MHLTSELALDFADGRLAADQQIYWKGHLDTCDACAQDVHGWWRLKGDLKRSHLMSAPDHDLKMAIQLFPLGSTESRPGFRCILAARILDSFLQPAMAGARGTAAARQVVLRAGDFDIHVKVWGELHGKQMLGQLLSRDGRTFGQAARFHLMQNGERLETTATNEMGEFHLRHVPEGNLSFQLDLPRLIVIGALHLERAR
jgi:hypothetical protein